MNSRTRKSQCPLSAGLARATEGRLSRSGNFGVVVGLGQLVGDALRDGCRGLSIALGPRDQDQLRLRVRMLGHDTPDHGNAMRLTNIQHPSSQEIIHATGNLPPLDLLRLAQGDLEMERVMGVEPMGESRLVSMLAASGRPAAIRARDFAAHGSLRGNDAN